MLLTAKEISLWTNYDPSHHIDIMCYIRSYTRYIPTPYAGSPTLTDDDQGGNEPWGKLYQSVFQAPLPNQWACYTKIVPQMYLGRTLSLRSFLQLPSPTEPVRVNVLTIPGWWVSHMLRYLPCSTRPRRKSEVLLVVPASSARDCKRNTYWMWADRTLIMLD